MIFNEVQFFRSLRVAFCLLGFERDVKFSLAFIVNLNLFQKLLCDLKFLNYKHAE
jgi:hypothetical protein